MRPGSRTVSLLSLTLALFLVPSGSRADLTQTYTDSAITQTNPDTGNADLTTNWTTSSPIPALGLHLPSVPQFNKAGATLNEVDVTVAYPFENKYSATFTTASTITIEALGPGAHNPPQPGDPGPSVGPVAGLWPLTSFQPTLQLTNAIPPGGNPSLTQSLTYGSQPGQTLPATFTSDLNPNLFNPVKLVGNNALSFNSGPLTSSNPNTAADFQKFIGSGQLAFPFTAQGYSTFTSSSGNGAGSVATYANATVTVTYHYSMVPEPASLVLLGLGSGCLLVIARRHGRRVGSPACA